MTPLTFLFVGRSGCGKGTQARLLSEYLQKLDGRNVYTLEGGSELRKYFEGTTYSSRLSRELNNKGELQPEFLSIWVWTGLLVNNLKEGEHLIVDGPGRRRRECETLDVAFDFYGREAPFIVHLDVSTDWSRTRMLARGRADDTEEAIARRLAWFEKETIPAMEFFRTNSKYRFVDINGEQPIEKVHQDIVTAVEDRLHGSR